MTSASSELVFDGGNGQAGLLGVPRHELEVQANLRELQNQLPGVGQGPTFCHKAPQGITAETQIQIRKVQLSGGLWAATGSPAQEEVGEVTRSHWRHCL